MKPRLNNHCVRDSGKVTVSQNQGPDYSMLSKKAKARLTNKADNSSNNQKKAESDKNCKEPLSN